MHIVILALALLQPGSQDLFMVHGELQGLYEELSQGVLQAGNETDLDDLDAVLYTPDWVLVDADGKQHGWPEIRDETIKAQTSTPLERMTQTIQKLSVASDRATVLVNVTIVRTIVDEDGRYGPKGRTLALDETNLFRDTWVKDSTGWKLKSRKQVGQPKLRADESEYHRYLKENHVS